MTLSRITLVCVWVCGCAGMWVCGGCVYVCVYLCVCVCEFSYCDDSRELHLYLFLMFVCV